MPKKYYPDDECNYYGFITKDMVLNFKPSWNCFDRHMMHQGRGSNYMFLIFKF